MDLKTKHSAIAESRVVTEMLRAGFSVFTQFSGKEPFDIAVYKEGVFKRVQVKSTNVRSKNGNSFVVQLRSIRPNKTRNTIKKFDAGLCDILAVYIVELDVVCFIPSKDLHDTSGIYIGSAGLVGRLRYSVETHGTLSGCSSW